MRVFPVGCLKQPEVRDHDPRAALDGGADGLEAYRSLFSNGASMQPDAYLVLEIGYDQGESVPKLAEQHGFAVVGLVNDLGGNPRVVTVKKASKE